MGCIATLAPAPSTFQRQGLAGPRDGLGPVDAAGATFRLSVVGFEPATTSPRPPLLRSGEGWVRSDDRTSAPGLGRPPDGRESTTPSHGHHSTSRPSSSAPARPAWRPATTCSGAAARSSSSTPPPASATTGDSSGTRCGSTPRQVRRPARAAVPRRPVVLPRQGRGGRLPRAVRRALRPPGAPRASASTALVPRPAAATITPTGADRSPATTSWSRPARSAGRRASPTSPATSTPASSSCTPVSTAARPAQRRAGARGRRVHSGTDIAYELALTHPTVLAGRDCGQIPVPLDSRRLPDGLPGAASSPGGTSSPGAPRWVARR